MEASVDMVPCRRKLMRNSDSNSAARLFMSIVTDDILREILVRLPHAKYAIRCSLVSKQWHSLIRDPQFRPEFCRQNPNKFELFFRFGVYISRIPTYVRSVYSEKESQTNRPFPNLATGTIAISSSIDLLVLRNGGENWSDNQIFVCNPLTSQSVRIPGPIPLPSPLRIGIVTDPENFGHYKVVLINLDDDYDLEEDYAGDEMLDIHVFCSRTRVWTHSRFHVPYTALGIDDAISNQGVLYFPFSNNERVVGVLVCSLLESSRFRLVERPQEFYRRGKADWTKVMFGVVSGRLRVSVLFKNKAEKVFSLKIWELRYDDESEFESDYSWLLVHDVSLRSGDDKTKLFLFAFHPYNGDEIFILRDYINICRYHNLGEDTYEIVGQLQITDRVPSRTIKKYFSWHITPFTLIHTPWPTPLSPELP